MGTIPKVIGLAVVALLSVTTTHLGWAQTNRETPPIRREIPRPEIPPASIGSEVCTHFDPNQITIGQTSNGNYALGAPVTNMADSAINLGVVSTQAFANRAVLIIKHYGWTQQCDVGNPSTGAIIYWK